MTNFYKMLQNYFIVFFQFICNLYLFQKLGIFQLKDYLIVLIQQIFYNLNFLIDSMNQNLKLLCTLAFLLYSSNAVYIQVNQQPFCLILDPIDKVDYKIFYESFETQSTLNTVIKTNGKRIILEGQTNQTVINGNQQILFCLKTKSKRVQNVFIDFYPTQESKYKKLALKSQVNEVHQQLINIGDTLRQINHLQQFQRQRQQINSQIMQKHQETIQFYGLIKSVVLVGVILVQFIYLRKKISMQRIKGFFNF